MRVWGRHVYRTKNAHRGNEVHALSEDTEPALILMFKTERREKSAYVKKVQCAKFGLINWFKFCVSHEYVHVGV